MENGRLVSTVTRRSEVLGFSNTLPRKRRDAASVMLPMGLPIDLCSSDGTTDSCAPNVMVNGISMPR